MELKNQRSGENVAVVICEELPEIITCPWVFRMEKRRVRQSFPLRSVVNQGDLSL